MIGCVRCGEAIGDSFRFCPWCGSRQQLKVSEFFPAHRGIERDPRALRVSRYVASAPPARHVRFSVWNETGEAQAAVSLDELEAERLARFLLVEPEPPTPWQRVRERVRASLAELRQ
jgi:hypothetical protein